MSEKFNRHIIQHGLLSLGIAVFALFTMRGFSWDLLLLFGFPTGLAVLHAFYGKSRMAEAFLISIGVASLVALLPGLFPNLGSHGTLGQPGRDRRLLTLYIGLYVAWLLVVLPIGLFGGSLRTKKRGGVPMFSLFTCYLGLFTAGLFWLAALLSLPKIVNGAGLWPVF